MTGVMAGWQRKVFVQVRAPNRMKYVRLAEEMGFGIEVIELANPSLDDLDQLALVAEYKKLLLEHEEPIVLHGAYIDVYVNSPDRDIRAIAQRRIIASLEHADRIGASRVVFHTNHLPCPTKDEYTETWRETSIAFWGGVVQRWDGEILLENMWDDQPALLAGVLDGVASDRMNACLDVGHANVFSRVSLSDWVRVLGDRLLYVHVSDNHGTADEDLPPGKGDIDWQQLSASLVKSAAKPAVMLGIGLGGTQAIMDSYDYLAARGLYPLDKQDSKGAEGGLTPAQLLPLLALPSAK